MCYSFISKVKQSLLTASCQSSCSEFLFWFSSACFLKWNCYFSACENLPNSPCHFWKHKSVFLQILHDSSVSWKITPLYFFRSNVIYFAQKKPTKVEVLRILSAQAKFTKFLSFLKQKISFSTNFALIFSDMRHNSSMLFLAGILYTFNQRNLSKYKFGEIWREQSKVWDFALWWVPFVQII